MLLFIYFNVINFIYLCLLKIVKFDLFLKNVGMDLQALSLYRKKDCEFQI